MADINKLVDEFHKSGENTISILQRIATEIGDGHVPSKLEGSEFSDSLFKLRKLYELITGAAEEELDNDEMPAAGSSVHTILKAVEEKRLLLYKKRIVEIEEAIGSFEKISSADFILTFTPSLRSASVASSLRESAAKLRAPSAAFSSLMVCALRRMPSTAAFTKRCSSVSMI